MEELRREIEEQGRKIDELCVCIKGEKSLGIEGLVPCVQRLESSSDKIATEIHDLNAWRKETVIKRGHISIQDAMKTIAWGLGVAGGFLALILALKDI